MIICSPQLSLSKISGRGGEIYDYHLLEGLTHEGVQLHIISPIHMSCEVSGTNRIKVHLSKGRYANWVFLRTILKFYREQGFDVLRIFSPRYVGIAGWIFHQLYPQIPIITQVHHLDSNWVDQALAKICARYSDRLITISEFSRSQLLAVTNLSPKRVVIIPPGVREAHFNNLSFQETQISTDVLGNHVILFIGNLISRKNLSFLISLFPEILLKIPNTCLVIGGDGVERNKLERHAADLGIDQAIYFTGFLSEDEKMQWLSICDVFVSPSKLEGFGMNVAEAMAHGKPVVASLAGSLPEVVENGVTGYVVPLTDQKSFVDAIVSLLRDQELRVRMGKAGQQRVRDNFRWNLTVQKTKNVLETLITERPGS